MRKHLLIACLIFASCVQAQDTIRCVSGNDIYGQVIEVNAESIKYVRSDNPNGPVYVEKKDNLESISYKNGLREVYVQKSTSDDEIKRRLKSIKGDTKTLKYICVISLVLSAIATILK